MVKRCFLRSLSGLHPDLVLPDARCSRHQVTLVADCACSLVRVTQNGANASAVNGTDIGRDGTVDAKEGDVIQVLSGEKSTGPKVNEP